MNEVKLIAIINQILDPDDHTTSDEWDELLEKFIDSVPHPGGSDLIFYSENWGLNASASAEEIARTALSWKPKVVAMTISYSRPHPSRDDLTCYGVQVDGRIQTQVVSPQELEVGDKCAVALSGVHLVDGTIVEHGFVDRVFSAGVIVGRTNQPVGTELPVPT